MGKTLRSVEADIARRTAARRDSGVPWRRIAEALGMDESEAMKRFGSAQAGGQGMAFRRRSS
jgi:hypothetical protein